MVVQETIFLKEYKNYTFYIYTEEKIGSSKHGATTIEEQQQQIKIQSLSVNLHGSDQRTQSKIQKLEVTEMTTQSISFIGTKKGYKTLRPTNETRLHGT